MEFREDRFTTQEGDFILSNFEEELDNADNTESAEREGAGSSS